MLTVWGRATSINVQAVMWCAAELGLRVERIDRGGAFGGLDSEAFVAMNPHRQIPVMRDGDMIMWESGAILRYLARRYGNDVFWPSDPAACAPIDMWAEWAKVALYAAFTKPIFYQLVRTPKSERNEAAIHNAITHFTALLHRVEARLGPQPYLLGAELTLADIALGHLLYRPVALGIMTADDVPHLSAYYHRLAERPAYAEHVMVDFESLRAPGA